MGHILVVAGHPAVGTSNAALGLTARLGWPLLSQKRLAGHIADAMMQTLTGDPKDRTSNVYRSTVLPLERKSISAAMSLIFHGGWGPKPDARAVLDLSHVTRDYLDELCLLATISRDTISGIWVACDDESWRHRLALRRPDALSLDPAQFASWRGQFVDPSLPSWMRAVDISHDRAALNEAADAGISEALGAAALVR